MSKEQFKAFQEKVKADTSLQEKLEAITDPKIVIAIAKSAGFEITTEDQSSDHQSLSDQELEGITGGARAAWGQLH